MRSPSLRRLVVISHALGGELARRSITPRYGDVVVAADAADPLRTGAVPEAAGIVPAALAEAVGTTVGYVGHLYSGRGFPIVRRLAERLPELTFHVIGGEDASVAELVAQGLPPNLFLHGFIAPALLPHLYARLDILLMPYQRQVMGASQATELSRWMSPMKMLEYMAAGRAIVASDLPVLGEVLHHDRNALMVPAEDIDTWVETLRSLDRDPALRRRLGTQAQDDWRTEHTWEVRAARVLEGADLAP
jgi:glycosyltransferase involved in cell wall biosynthesis